MKYPITKIWAQDSSNKLNLTESQIANGIAYQGAVVSNQLNGIANRTDLAIDEIQRFSMPYDNSKVYQKYDICYLKVFYNGMFYLVGLMWINDTAGNVTPFIEKESVVNTKLQYLANSTVLEIDTPNNILYDSMQEGFWKILNKDFSLNAIDVETTSQLLAVRNNILLPCKNIYLYDIVLLNSFILAKGIVVNIYTGGGNGAINIYGTLISNTQIKLNIENTTSDTITLQFQYVKFR